MTSELALPLIVCAGEKVSWICGTLVHRIPPSACRIVMSDWIDDSTLSRACIFWVVDPRFGKRGVQRAMRLGIPILVPEENREFRRICLKGQCGLYYTSCDDAEAAIRYLLEREVERNMMGENARRFASTL